MQEQSAPRHRGLLTRSQLGGDASCARDASVLALLRVIAEDLDHGGGEQRYFASVRSQGAIMTGDSHGEPKDRISARILAERKGDL